MIETARVLCGIPSALREPLLSSYNEISSYYIEGKWGPAELDGGKLAEIVYTIISDVLMGTNSAAPLKPPQMLQACQALEKLPASSLRVGDRSLRILIPRMLPVLYEVRNNRNVGHVGGDVDPNHMDATVVYSMSSWLMAELIRIFHDVSTNEAQEMVDALVERKSLLVWTVGDKKRVLDPNLSAKDQTLILLHQTIGWVLQKDLSSWVEYASTGMFGTRVLRPLHDQRMVEWEMDAKRARISPLGIADVERRLLRSRT
jgi:hypothetical protein